MSSVSFRDVPPEAFTQSLRVRSYEVGQGGAIGIGTLLRYLESLATEASAAAGFDNAWYTARNAAWVVREMDIRLGALPTIGAELLLATWVSEFRRVQAQREYAVWRPGDQHLVARASARWAYVDGLRGQPVRVHDEILEQIAVPGQRMPARDLPALDPLAESALRGEWQIAARAYEGDTRRHINNCVYADWLGEALQRTLLSRPPATCLDRLSPRMYHLDYLRPVRPSDDVRIVTKVERRGTRGLRAQQEIADASAGAPSVRARSAYLLLAGCAHDTSTAPRGRQ